jgi:phenylpyruvate tautomerase
VPSRRVTVNRIGPATEDLSSRRYAGASHATLAAMPLLQIQTSASLGARGAPADLLKNLSALLARELGKPESYVMLSFEHDAQMLFGGSAQPACFATLKNIGTFTPQQTEKLSALLCAQLSESLSVAPSRIYLEFVDAKPHLWGYDGGTFA